VSLRNRIVATHSVRGDLYTSLFVFACELCTMFRHCELDCACGSPYRMCELWLEASSLHRCIARGQKRCGLEISSQAGIVPA